VIGKRAGNLLMLIDSSMGKMVVTILTEKWPRKSIGYEW